MFRDGLFFEMAQNEFAVFDHFLPIGAALAIRKAILQTALELADVHLDKRRRVCVGARQGSLLFDFVGHFASCIRDVSG